MDRTLKLLEDESFQRWLSGLASEREQDRWQAWLNESSQNRDFYEESKRLWNLGQFKGIEATGLDDEVSRLRERVMPLVNSRRKARGKTKPNRYHQGYHTPWPRFATLAGAALVVMLLFYNFSALLNENADSHAPRKQSISTENGQRATLSLPGGTKIILNANSSLIYPTRWNETSSHHLELQGEAYFDVAEDYQKSDGAFIVHTADGSVRVVGTLFAVYERGKGTRVVVEKGGVEVYSYDTRSLEDKTLEKVRLLPGHMVKFSNKERTLKTQTVEVDPYVTWWHRHMRLRHTPFKEIVQRLEETYGVDVKITNESLLERMLSGSIENQNLVTVTDALAEALKVNVQRNGNTIIFGE